MLPRVIAKKKRASFFFDSKKLTINFYLDKHRRRNNKDKSFGKVTTNDQQTTVVKRNSCQRKNSKMVKIAFPYTVDDGTFRRRVESRVASRCVDLRDEAAAAAVRFKASYNLPRVVLRCFHYYCCSHCCFNSSFSHIYAVMCGSLVVFILVLPFVSFGFINEFINYSIRFLLFFFPFHFAVFTTYDIH